MIRIRINPPLAKLYPNDRQLFTVEAEPPPAMWVGATDGGDIKSDFSLEVDPAGSTVSGFGGHRLMSGLGFVEFTIDDQCRPTSTNEFVINGFIFDTAGFLYKYSLQISSTAVEVRNEADTQIYTETYSTVSGDVYRLELNAGFRFYRNGVPKHSRVNLPTAVTYPMEYQCVITENTVAAPTRIPAPKLIGNWRLHPQVTWTVPSHGLISRTLAISTEYIGGVVPGRYTLTAQLEPGTDATGVQKATATIEIPPFQIIGPTEITLQPSRTVRFKANYEEAQAGNLVAWSVLSGAGSFTQGEFTASSTPGVSIVRATANLEGFGIDNQVADITVTVPAVITNVGSFTAAKPSEQIDFDTNILASALPFFVGAGAVAEGTGNVTPGFPLGVQDKDLLLVTAQSANESVANPSGGFVPTADSPQGTGTAGAAGSTRLSIFHGRWVPGLADPVITDPGDHVIAQILAFRGVIASGDPWDVTAGDTGSSSTSVSIPGDTTTVANCLVVQAVAHGTDTAAPQVSGYANAGLANLAERTDIATTQGNGGGFAVVTGEKATAGAFGATAATLANASTQGRLTIALKPAVITWSASIGSINSGTGVWTAPSLPGQAAKITATNGMFTATIEVPVLEVFPRTDVALPWPIDYGKKVLISEAEDDSFSSRIKRGARRSFPVSLRVDAVADVNGAGLDTIRKFWDRHFPGPLFILDDPEEGVRLRVRADSDLRWEYTDAGINIAFRVKEA